MFGALAEFERSLIRERTQAGLAATRRLGRTRGRPPKLTDDDIEAARAMLADPDIPVTQIAQRTVMIRPRPIQPQHSGSALRLRGRHSPPFDSGQYEYRRGNKKQSNHNQSLDRSVLLIWVPPREKLDPVREYEGKHG
jgi:hypothetical protein